MKALKFLKTIDIFSLPVNTFYTSRDKKLNEKSYHIYHGSKLGGCLTLFFGIVLLSTFAHKVVQMFSGDLSFNKNETFINMMDSDENRLVNMTDSDFMASV